MAKRNRADYRLERNIPVLFMEDNSGLCFKCPLPDCFSHSPKCIMRIEFLKTVDSGKYIPRRHRNQKVSP